MANALKRFFLITIFFSIIFPLCARKYTISGTVIDDSNSEPLGYATVKLPATGLRAVTDEEGKFTIANVEEGIVDIEISILGYALKSLNIRLDKDINLQNVRLKEENLSLPDLEVTASTSTKSGTTSYLMDRSVLDHAQMLNLSDIMSLLPGVQTVNSSLMNDSRFSLRSGSGECGNASFGTAIEVDGVRLDNNANMEETMSASTRNVSSSNIGKVEVVPGIPGVEYGDVSNGVVKITPRRGLTPWIIECSINPCSAQAALNKGFALHSNGGILNFSIEHAQSFNDIASPYTSYRRNILSAAYVYTFCMPTSTLNLEAGVTGNLGGYSSKADPDAFKDTYTKTRDNHLQGNLRLNWIFNTDKVGIFRMFFQGGVIYSDKLTESHLNTSSSSSQPYLHKMSDGYAIAQPYIEGEELPDIVLGPTGYWYVHQYNDQKPISFQSKLKGEWTKEWGTLLNKMTLGADFQMSRNNGRGIYYDDMAVAPTWRPYDYRRLPTMNNIAVFLEERLLWDWLTMTAGLRTDVTDIRKSEYGTVTTFSPRINMQVSLYKRGRDHVNFYAGYGKGYKLPSFQVLYPADSYTDKLTFTPGSTADNKAYYAYYTHVSKYIYNKDLKWQSVNQADLGLEAQFRGITLGISAYLNNTRNPYQQVNIYTPFTYLYTSQAALENFPIAPENRQYEINPQTGVVTVVSTVDGNRYELPYSKRNTYISNRRFINGSPVNRYGVEWMMNLPLTGKNHPIGLELRLDGNYYRYKGISNTLIAGSPAGIGDYAEESGIMPLLGYYGGSNVTSSSSVSTASVSNGFLSKGCSMNTTLTLRIPKLRMIMTLRLESTFLNYKRNLANIDNAIMLEAPGDVTGKPYTGESDRYVAIYPEFYSTWDNPSEKIPFAEALANAHETDEQLYRQLCNLIIRSNTSYYFNPQNISAYFSANFSITKEIGKWISISFYANNFFNNMSFVRNTQTGLESSLFSSGYIPGFYYGVSLRIKL